MWLLLKIEKKHYCIHSLQLLIVNGICSVIYVVLIIGEIHTSNRLSGYESLHMDRLNTEVPYKATLDIN